MIEPFHIFDPEGLRGATAQEINNDLVWCSTPMGSAHVLVCYGDAAHNNYAQLFSVDVEESGDISAVSERTVLSYTGYMGYSSCLIDFDGTRAIFLYSYYNPGDLDYKCRTRAQVLGVDYETGIITGGEIIDLELYATRIHATKKVDENHIVVVRSYMIGFGSYPYAFVLEIGSGLDTISKVGMPWTGSDSNFTHHAEICALGEDKFAVYGGYYHGLLFVFSINEDWYIQGEDEYISDYISLSDIAIVALGSSKIACLRVSESYDTLSVDFFSWDGNSLTYEVAVNEFLTHNELPSINSPFPLSLFQLDDTHWLIQTIAMYEGAQSIILQTLEIDWETFSITEIDYEIVRKSVCTGLLAPFAYNSLSGGYVVSIWHDCGLTLFLDAYKIGGTPASVFSVLPVEIGPVKYGDYADLYTFMAARKYSWHSLCNFIGDVDYWYTSREDVFAEMAADPTTDFDVLSTCIGDVIRWEAEVVPPVLWPKTYPVDGQGGIGQYGPLYMRVYDSKSGVDLESIELSVDSIVYTYSSPEVSIISINSPWTYVIKFVPSTPWSIGSAVDVSLCVWDKEGNPGLGEISI